MLTKLKDYGHTKLYYSKKTSHDYVEQSYAENMDATVPGFSTTVKTRPMIISKLEEFIRNKVLKIKSKRLLNELKTFIWNHGKAQAMRSYNDDLVMACAIGCWVRDTALTVNEQDIQYKKVMIDAIMISNKSLDTRISGMNDNNKDNYIYNDNKKHIVVSIDKLPFFMK